jgi:uncharacterized protein YjbI with pentapeptide repeats
MTDELDHAFRGAGFRGADFRGASFRECDMREVRIVGSEIADLHISGFAGQIENLIVNDVDVTAFVQGELDRRHPERLQLRAVRTADDHRAMWATIERLWSDTLADVQRLPESARDAKVDDEWSLVETLRHLIFAADVWVGRMVLGQPMPYHPLGLPPTDYPAADAAGLGLDIAATPSFSEVLDVRADRMVLVRSILTDVTDADLEAMRTGEPAPGWGEESLSMRRCLRVVLNEECEHRRYAVRDLAILATRAEPTP